MENYDPNKPVCDNQDDFNQAFRKALKYNTKQNMKKAQPWIWIYMGLYLVFIIWALILAMRVPVGPARTMHVLFAFVGGPVYVLSYYLAMIKG